MIAPEAGLSISRQCTLMGIARSSFYYRQRPESAEELELLKRAHFSGDPNPQDRLKQTYDPLFTTGGDRGFGSWFLGEIFGQYISPNSNLNVAMAHLKFSPLDTVEADLPTEGQTRGPSGGRYRSRAALFRDHEYCRFGMRQNVVTYSVKNSSSCAKRSQINSFCLRQNISTKPVDNLVDNIGPAHARQSDFDDS
jgi:hypothetical protein